MSVPALCAGRKPLKELAPGCKVQAIPVDTGCDHKKRWRRIASPGFRGNFIPFAHHDCLHNQEIAIRNRVLGAVPAPTKEGLAQLRKQARVIGRLLPHVAPDDWYVLPNRYSGAKRAKYIRATDDVISGGLTAGDAGIKMFVKFEKLSPKKENPDPRAIQFRNPKYCVALARYLKPIEHHLYNLHGNGKDLPRTRVIGKGLSMADRAKLLVEKRKRFLSPVVLSLDAARFDQHVAFELLQIEHSVYLQACNDPFFAKLLMQQLVNKCRSSKGIKYRARGKRMSGDMNTALGNCLLMILMVSTFMRGKDYDILDDGDDCLLIIEESLLPWVLENIQKTFLTYGHELKVENVSKTLHGIEWCQGKIIEYDKDKFKFVRNPFKVMSVALGGVKFMDEHLGPRARLVNTIGMAELILNLGVPVLQEYALALMRNAGTTDSITMETLSQLNDGSYWRLSRELQAMNMKCLTRRDPVRITDDARVSFSEAYDISVQEQLDMEDFLRGWEFNLLGDETRDRDIDVATWRLASDCSREVYHP